MGKINIGAFTDRITFLKAINSKGEMAQLHKQYVIALEKIHVVTYTLPGVNTSCIIRWGSCDYNVSCIVHDKTRPFMELDAIKMLKDER